ncbi:hypothetical protein AB1283_00830 [Bacillus sp. S13(2024)]|uniref:hypothetical protein n=1 Tax=Bacillus sp. S13(2024) TaxID=3162885 RepID=UPI003D1AA437
MAHWVDTYPHKVYASVLLLDNKIYNWKIGQRYWDSPFSMTIRTSDMEKFSKMKTKYIHWEVNTSDEHQEVFEKHAREWFKQFEIHEEYIGSDPY